MGLDMYAMKIRKPTDDEVTAIEHTKAEDLEDSEDFEAIPIRDIDENTPLSKTCSSILLKSSLSITIPI